MNTILLTGATGLLGNEILRVLLHQDSSARILVLVRGNPKSALKKFENLVDEPQRVQFTERVEPVWADLEREGLGLTGREHEVISERVTHIIHSAAAVDFALSYSAARSANFDGTIRLLDFARSARHLKAFAYVSTAHVAGRRTGCIAEAELDHNRGFVNFYEQTKYETEQYLRDGMGDLPIAVYRSTTLIGDSRNGAVRQFNFFHNAIRLYYHGLVPAIPGDPRGHLDLIPVDWAARAIGFLAIEGFRPGTTYHVCAEPPRSYDLQGLIDATLQVFETSPESKRRGIPKPAIVTPEQFNVMVEEARRDGRGKILQLFKPLSYFMPHLALPKVFEAKNLHRDLPVANDMVVPDVREYYPKVVDYCLRMRWGRS
jgi:thioester reductase-like protein